MNMYQLNGKETIFASTMPAALRSAIRKVTNASQIININMILIERNVQKIEPKFTAGDKVRIHPSKAGGNSLQETYGDKEVLIVTANADYVEPKYLIRNHELQVSNANVPEGWLMKVAS